MTGNGLTGSWRRLRIIDLLCVLAVIGVCFMGVAGHGLWSPDEPREAAMSLSMAKSGDWVIPRLAGTPFVEKPPLYYITAVWSIKAFGPLVDLTTAIRMTTALYGIGTLLMTFLLGYRIGGLRAGFLSAVFLGTMEGFVENFHWIRVDAALSFFVVATVVCLREMYHEDRYEMGALAGAFMAGSFLSKGFVGPVLCGIPWAVLFIHRLVEHRTSPVPFGRFVLHHLVLGCVFVLLSGLWVLIFYMRGDEALWHEWFWVNHVGRLTGEAVEKGHIIRGKPLYYVFQLLGYAVPWSPLVFFWFGEAAVRAVRERRVSRERLFLFGWGGLSLVVLSVSATKRGIYLTPVLPVFAVTAALAMGEESPRWFRPWGIFWVVLAMGLVLIVAFCPFFTGILPGKIPPKILESLSRFGGYNVLSLFGFAICPYLIHKFRLKLTDARALVLVTAVLYISLFGYPARAIDAEKNMGPDIREFVSKIPEDRWKKIAATELTESMTGCLYFYGGMDVHLVWDKQRLDDIVAGRDPEYDSLIIKRKTRRLDDDQNLIPVPYTVLAKGITATDTALFWIQGAPPQ